MSNLTGSHEDLIKLYGHVSPVQYPTRYILDLESNELEVKPQLLHSNGHLPLGGADFPLINPLVQSGELAGSGTGYNYAWMNGFREVYHVDSVYKLDIKTGNTICRHEDGYVPSEGVFVPLPDGYNEDDGILIHQWLSLVEDKKPKVTFINAKNLNLIAELEIPVNLPFGIHGIVVDIDL